jgi:hypothetical protein
MDTVQPSRADATPDPAFVGAGPTQLIGRHHAVLPRRHSRCCTIRPLDEFLSHTENKSSRAVRAPELAPERTRGDALCERAAPELAIPKGIYLSFSLLKTPAWSEL